MIHPASTKTSQTQAETRRERWRCGASSCESRIAVSAVGSSKPDAGEDSTALLLVRVVVLVDGTAASAKVTDSSVNVRFPAEATE